MNLKYDISNYIASVKMSSKKRILVEGRNDKSHISNLLDVLLVAILRTVSCGYSPVVTVPFVNPGNFSTS